MRPARQRFLRRWGSEHPVTLGYALALGAAFSYGTSQFVASMVISRFSPPLVTTTYSLMFGTLFLLPFSYRYLSQARRASGRALLFILLAGITTSGGVALMFSALSLAPIVVVSPVASVHPLVALGLTHLFLQRLERVTARLLVGALLVVAGVALVAVGQV